MIIFSPRIGRHAKAITMSLPNCTEILAFIEGHTAKIRKREIARAFNLDSDQRKMLKKLLSRQTLEVPTQNNKGHLLNLKQPLH